MFLVLLAITVGCNNWVDVVTVCTTVADTPQKNESSSPEVSSYFTVTAGGVGCNTSPIGNAGQPCGRPQSQSPGVFRPAGTDPPVSAAACLSS